MFRIRHRVIATLLLTSVSFASSASAESITIPFQAALAESEDCVATDGLGWHARSDATTCVVSFPITVPVGRKIDQIAVLHGTGDYAAASQLDAALMIYPATTPWQQAVSLFAMHDGIVHTAFDVEATRLMQQSGKVFADAFAVQEDTVYSMTISTASSAFVAGVKVTYQ